MANILEVHNNFQHAAERGCHGCLGDILEAAGQQIVPVYLRSGLAILICTGRENITPDDEYPFMIAEIISQAQHQFRFREEALDSGVF